MVGAEGVGRGPGATGERVAVRMFASGHTVRSIAACQRRATMNEPTRRLVSSPSRPLASETSRILFLSIASARSTADADWPSTLRTLRVRRLDRGLALLNRPRIAVGGKVAGGADGAEKGRQRCEQAGDPIAATVDDCIEVASGVGGEGEQDREQNRRTARQERPEAGSMKSLHVLRIPLEEAKTNGLDRTLCARCPHAELKRPPTVGAHQT